MALDSAPQFWNFDISSLMILVGEGEEHKYRLSRRFLEQCLVTVPVAGLQNYVRSYDLLFEPSSLSYFSPYGRKSAPLRNSRLEHAIRLGGLLQDHKYTVFTISSCPRRLDGHERAGASKQAVLVVLWVFTTWVLFAGLLVSIILVPGGTWVGLANCASYTVWSAILRCVEYVNVVPAPYNAKNLTDPDEDDAIFIMGRDSSAFVLKGRREDIKEWTSRGLIYKEGSMGISARLWRGFTRLGSLLILLFIFSTIPNGSTVDQVAFLILNGLAQLNVLLGQRLNGRCCLARLTLEMETREETRTHVYARLIRQFGDIERNNAWIEASNILPRTDVWDEWKKQVLVNDETDPKRLYKEIHDSTTYP